MRKVLLRAFVFLKLFFFLMHYYLYNNLKYNVNLWKCPASSFLFCFIVCVCFIFLHTMSGCFVWGDSWTSEHPLLISALVMSRWNVSILESGRYYSKFNMYYLHFPNLEFYLVLMWDLHMSIILALSTEPYK